ncbi:MAG: PQQ-binding-like beta-propeller repeat protein [Parvibaculaceae bacterium]|nr:PQQ-binding-like beta-propeller repeat protein [Parvibaculaceae bacterium]
MKMRIALVGLATLVTLSGCDTVSDWIKPASAERLPGERISIMALERTLEADPRLASLEVVLPRPYVNEDWPQPGGYADNAMHHLQASGSLTRQWRADAGTGSGGSTELATAPVMAEGRVYVLDAETTIGAFDAATGKRVWEVELTPDNESSDEGRGGGAAYEAGRVFVTTGFGEVVALNAASGEVYWRTPVGTPFRAAPTVNGGRVFSITSDNQLICVNAENGEVLWRHRGIVESAGILAATSPAVSGSIVIAPYSSGELFALRVENGNTLWSDSLTRTGNITSLTELNDIAGRPVIDRGRVYAVSHSGRAVSIDIRTGERVWTRNIAGVQTPWVAGGFIFLVTTDAEVVALSQRDGRIRWIQQLPRFEDEEDRDGPITWSGPVLAGDRLILASSLGEAVSLSPYTGEVLGRVELPDGVYLPPIVANETLYVLTDSADLVALK